MRKKKFIKSEKPKKKIVKKTKEQTTKDVKVMAMEMEKQREKMLGKK